MSRTTTVVFALSLAAVTAACGGRQVAVESAAPAAVATLDPVGMYDFTATLGGETRTGTIHIQPTSSGGYGGEARLEGEPQPAPIDSVRVDGDRMVINASPSGQNVIFELEFAGSSFTGFVFAGDDAVPLTGTKRAP